MYSNPLLLLFLFLLSGAFFLLFFRPEKDLLIKNYTLGVTFIAFVYSLGLLYYFDTTSAAFQFESSIAWLRDGVLRYGPLGGDKKVFFHLGIDGISVFFIILTTFLVPVCILASWNSIKTNFKLYAILFLIMEALLIIVFSVIDLLLFYVFFEAILIPMFLIIGIWGGSKERKIKAAYYFFLYTLLGSVLMLVGIMFIFAEYGTTDLYTLYNIKFSHERELFLWASFFIAMAVKIPMFPAHIWLPEAHVEAPTAGSVILAGVLLKMGGYGFIRFLIPLFPYATQFFLPLVFTLSVISILYASLTTLRQIDMKRVVAYSSVAHMNFVVLGIFSLNQIGLEGAVLLMLGHGIVSSALFLLVGVLYDRYHSRLLKYYGGLAQVMPVFAIFFLFFNLSNLSLPGTSNFIGEFLVFMGTAQASTVVAFLAGISIVLCAAYSVWLFNRVCFGDLKVQFIKEFYDMNSRELFYILVLVFLTLLMGIYPEIFLNFIKASAVKHPVFIN